MTHLHITPPPAKPQAQKTPHIGGVCRVFDHLRNGTVTLGMNGLLEVLLTVDARTWPGLLGAWPNPET